MDKRAGDAGISAEDGTSNSAIPDQSAASVPVSAKDPQWGKATAPVTIVEISDFQCPFCSRVEPTMTQLRQKYGPDKIRIVWKNNPLPFHNHARPTAEAAATVFGLAGSDAFWKFHDAAFANQQALGDESSEKWAKEAGVDLAKFKAAYAAKKYAAKVDEDLALAKKIDASGTPAFRINGVTLSGAQPIDKFTEVIDAQLAEAKKLVASGTKPADVYVTLTNKNQVAKAAAPNKPAPDAEEEDKSVWKVLVQDDDPIRGPKDALVTMIIFSDFQCPFCKRVEDTLKQVAAAYPQDVRFVWKDNPLPFHPRAKPSATLARFAYKSKGDKGFWDMHDAIFDSNPKLEDEDLKGLAEKAGLKWDDVKAAIDSGKFAEKIDGSVELANDVQARGTPHFFINGGAPLGRSTDRRLQEVDRRAARQGQGPGRQGYAQGQGLRRADEGREGSASAGEEGNCRCWSGLSGQGWQERQGHDHDLLGLPVPLLQARRAHAQRDGEGVWRQDQVRVAQHAVAVSR